MCRVEYNTMSSSVRKNTQTQTNLGITYEKSKWVTKSTNQINWPLFFGDYSTLICPIVTTYMAYKVSQIEPHQNLLLILYNNFSLLEESMQNVTFTLLKFPSYRPSKWIKELCAFIYPLFLSSHNFLNTGDKHGNFSGLKNTSDLLQNATKSFL